MKGKWLVFGLGCFMFMGISFTAHGQTVSGMVRDAATNNPLPGVNILVKGTSTGAATDSKGHYSLRVPSLQDTLRFSFIGYQTKTVPLNGRKTINISLKPSVVSGKQLVVTALGIKQQKRALGYAVSTVSSKELNDVNNPDVLNSLKGQIPGVDIRRTGAVGSTVKAVIRGATSLRGGNQPLYVIDGVPVEASTNNIIDFGSGNKVDFGNAISDLNPEDIANVTVLKGPSAAALYGSRASNGVILITTKKGKRNSGLGITLHTNTVVAFPYKYVAFVNTHHAQGERPYTPDNHPGSGPLTIDQSEGAWDGPELDVGYKAVQWNSPKDANGNPIPTPLVSYPNEKNFFQNAITTTNGITISNGTNNLVYRLDYSNMRNRGVVPNTSLFHNNFALSTTYNLSKDVVVNANVHYINSNSDNRIAGDRDSSPFETLAYLNPSINVLDLRDYWVPGKEGQEVRSYGPGQENPYFQAYQAIHSFNRNRVFGKLQATWNITRALSIQGKYTLNTHRGRYETNVSKGYVNNPNGVYGVVYKEGNEQVGTIRAAYKKSFNKLFFNATAGGIVRENKANNLNNTTNTAGIVLPGLFNLNNVLPTSINFSNYISNKRVYSVFGKATLGYQEMIYLNLTGRNDWSSTLPRANRSFFYPSASLSMLLNQMLHMPSVVSKFKLRGGWGRVGNDTGPYQLQPVLGNVGAWGNATRLTLPSSIPNSQLKPEISQSYEFGGDLAFFDNRFRISTTYYNRATKNQIITVNTPLSSGYSSRLINGGKVTSHGVGITLGITPTPASSNWNWDINVNFSRNRTALNSLMSGKDHFIFWSQADGLAMTRVGDDIGAMYGRTLQRVEDKSSPYYGYPIVGPDGSWQNLGSDPSTMHLIGNFNPNFKMGFQTSVSFKNLTISAVLDWRQGGDFISNTYRYVASDGHSIHYNKSMIKYHGPRDQLPQWLKEHADKYLKRGVPLVGGISKETGGLKVTKNGITLNDGVFVPGVRVKRDVNGNITGYTENLGGPGTVYGLFSQTYGWDYAQLAMFSSSYLNLRSFSIGYSLPRNLIQLLGLQNARVSVYTQNVLLWTKAKIGINPEHAFMPEGSSPSGTDFQEGVERYQNRPFTFPFGFKISFKF